MTICELPSHTYQTVPLPSDKLTIPPRVVATGARYKEDTPFKNITSTEDTKASLKAWRERIRSAKSIVVAGGGITGVELAAELGET